MKRHPIALVGALVFLMSMSLTAHGASCPTGSSKTPDQMADAMMDVFTPRTNWVQPDAYPHPTTGDYYAISWVHSAGAANPTFVTNYRKGSPNGTRFTGPGGKSERTIEILGKNGNTYYGWLKINAGPIKARLAMGSLNATQKEVITRDGRFVKVLLSSIKFRSSRGNCILETVTDPRYQGFGDILSVYRWARPNNQL